MKTIKLLCFSLLAIIGFVFAGEYFILYLDGFDADCISTDFYYQGTNDSSPEKMVNDILSEAEKAGLGIFTIVTDSRNKFSTVDKIYCSDGVDTFIQNHYHIAPQQYRSLFLGTRKVEFYSFDQIIDNNEDITDVCQFSIIGDMSAARSFKSKLIDTYAGSFPRNGVKKYHGLYIFGIWMIIVTLVLFLTYFEIQFNKKECHVCVTLGSRISQLLVKFLLPDLVAFSAIFWIEFAVVRLFTNANFQFHAALLAMGVLIGTDVAFYVISFGSFKIKKAFAGLSLTNRQLYANYALKLGTLVVTLAVVSGNIAEIDRAMQYYRLSDFFDRYSDYAFIQFTYDRYSENPEEIYQLSDDAYDFDSNVRDIEFYLTQQQSGNNLTLYCSRLFGDRITDYIIADSGALPYLSEKMEEASLLNNEGMEEFYVLMPKNMPKEQREEALRHIEHTWNSFYDDDEEEERNLERNYTVLQYKENVNLCAMSDYDGDMQFCENHKNPIILYFKDYPSANQMIDIVKHHERDNWTAAFTKKELKKPELTDFPNYVMLYRTSEEEVKAFVNTHNEVHNLGYTFTNAKEMYEYYKESYDKILMLNSTLSILVIFLEIIISIIIIRTEYSVNAKELFIRKTLGYSTVENNKRVILYTCVPLGLFILLSLGLYAFAGMNLMIYYALIGLLLLLFELLLIGICVMKMEKISTHNMIKGGIL